jgi:hypothetical protein
MDGRRRAAVFMLFVASTAIAGTATFTYDDAGRLTNAIYPGCKSIGYTLDAAGNRTQATAIVPSSPPGTLQFTASTVTVDEYQASLTLTVSRIGGSFGVLRASYATADGTAVSGNDYTAASGTLTWANGNAASQNIVIPIVSDSTYEGLQTFTVNLSPGAGCASIGSPASVAVSISDEPGVINMTGGIATFGESVGTYTIYAARSGGRNGNVSVNYSTADFTATGGQDYTHVTGTVSWNAGEAGIKPIVIPIANDAIYEGTSEQFTVSLFGPVGAPLGTPFTHTLVINDDDPPPVFHINDVSTSEDAAAVWITITKVGQTAFTHQVSFATAMGTAAYGEPAPDFNFRSGNISFAPGDTALQFNVGLISDAAPAYEGASEYFLANLSSPTAGAVLGDAQAVVTLTETAPAPRFWFGGAGPVMEGSNLVFTINKSNRSWVQNSVSYATASNTATGGQDYTDVSGVLTFEGSETSKTITVPTTDDAAVESLYETFALYVTNPTNGAIIDALVPVYGEIQDNDSNIPSTPTNFRFPSAQAGVIYGGTLGMAWNASTGPVSYYTLETDRDPDFTQPADYTTNNVNAPATSLSLTKGNLHGDRTFYARVRACNASAQCSSWTPTAEVMMCHSQGFCD